MIEFGITIVLVVLLITILIVINKRKKCSSCCSSKEALISEPKAPELVKQQPELKSADKPTGIAEPSTVNPQITDATVVSSPKPKSANKPIGNIELSANSQAKETAVSPAENNSSLLPQDSILKRHYLTHLCTMIETLAPPSPTDSVLCRHYNTMIAAEIDECLNNKKAMEQLIYDYENRK